MPRFAWPVVTGGQTQLRSAAHDGAAAAPHLVLAGGLEVPEAVVPASASPDVRQPIVERIELHGAVIDLRAGVVRDSSGSTSTLRRRLLNVLRHLAAHAGTAVSKDDLLNACWPGVVVGDESLTVAISALRQILGKQGREVIRTVPRCGYMFVPPDPHRISVAVAPFAAFSDEQGDAAFGRGLAAELVTEIARDGEIGVIARDSVFAARDGGTIAAEIARMFGVRYVLDGSVRRSSGRVVVNVHLIDGSNSRTAWAERYGRDRVGPDEVDGLVADIAAAVLSELRALERSERPQRARPTRAALRSVSGVL
jgi:TolB-like protein